MSTSLSTMIRLRAIQNITRKIFEEMNDLQYRLQFHHELSPAGWHLYHGLFIENYWLHEVIQNNNQFTEDKSLFIPENCAKPERGPRLRPLKQVLAEMAKQQDNNALFLLEKTAPLSEHTLFKNEYIENFIIQHYAQHYETIQMVLQQIRIKSDNGEYQPQNPLLPAPGNRDVTHIPQGNYRVGGEAPLSYDNELPAHEIPLNAFYISIHPVSNAEYLYFMQQGGYTDKTLWSDEGWQWLEQHNARHPEHWKQNAAEQWYGINHQGAFELTSDEPVYGINYFEACAFAKWAGARLPHEHEWETAAKLAALSSTAKAWEWCSNTFYPYENFQPFPYDEYSLPWFNNNHYVLKGGSPHTRPEIKRATFRNFYLPHQRHIFAGLRLVYA